MSSIQPHFSELTLSVTKLLSKQEKKEYGIFITPRSIIAALYDSIKSLVGNDISRIRYILEPSCGTCEIVQYCDEMLNNVKIDAIELNPTIFESIESLVFKNSVRLYNANFLEFATDTSYDLIIGNPPYFVCKKYDIPSEYEDYVQGRPNIFGIFILHALQLLKPGGILALVIPNSFLNSFYYAKIRDHIKATCSILKIEDYSHINDFLDTEQNTIGLIVRKHNILLKTPPMECAHSMLFNSHFVFTTDAKQLKSIFDHSTTLANMGLKVRTGQVVWNQVKDELTDYTKSTLLVYNSNLSKDNTLEIKSFKNDEKKQYINRAGRTDPVLVVNRGNGNSKYKLQYAIVRHTPFLVENHLNEIYSPEEKTASELIDLYEKITKSFAHPNTQRFIDIFLGNNSLSKTELETIFPIYL